MAARIQTLTNIRPEATRKVDKVMTNQFAPRPNDDIPGEGATPCHVLQPGIAIHCYVESPLKHGPANPKTNPKAKYNTLWAPLGL